MVADAVGAMGATDRCGSAIALLAVLVQVGDPRIGIINGIRWRHPVIGENGDSDLNAGS